MVVYTIKSLGIPTVGTHHLIHGWIFPGVDYHFVTADMPDDFRLPLLDLNASS